MDGFKKNEIKKEIENLLKDLAPASNTSAYQDLYSAAREIQKKEITLSYPLTQKEIRTILGLFTLACCRHEIIMADYANHLKIVKFFNKILDMTNKEMLNANYSRTPKKDSR